MPGLQPDVPAILLSLVPYKRVFCYAVTNSSPWISKTFKLPVSNFNELRADVVRAVRVVIELPVFQYFVRDLFKQLKHQAQPMAQTHRSLP
jgi:hypothetical protein